MSNGYPDREQTSSSADGGGPKRGRCARGATSSPLRVAWKLHSLDHRIASVRYRAILPVLALNGRGVASRLYRSPGLTRLERADVVVFVKSVTVKDLMLAQRLHARGVPIVLDLCDNIFVPNYMRKFPVRPADVFEAMAQYAAAITTTGPALAEVIRRRVGPEIPVLIVPDGIETRSTAAQGRRLLVRAKALDVLQKLASPRSWINGGLRAAEKVQRLFAGAPGSVAPAAATHPDVRRPRSPAPGGAGPAAGAAAGPGKTVIWFGNAGAEYGRFGLSDVVDIAAHLEKAFARVPFELLVVSNDRDAYLRLIKPLPFPSRYLPWNAETIQDQIKGSCVAIIPNSSDPFAICKSANRAVLALHLGVPVVASRTPALEVLRECVVLDDWEQGIVRYLTDPGFGQEHVSKASSLLAREFGPAIIAARWSEALHLARNGGRRASDAGQCREAPKLVVALHLVQDLDLAVPVLKEAQGRNDLALEVWVSKSLIEKSPRVLRTLLALEVSYSVIADDSVMDLRGLRFETVDALLTIAETDQRAHKIPHLITKRANAAGVHTYTMQHGFENIGLTYTDSVHPVDKVRFAAKTLFTWGPLASLHPDVREETRSKCVPVGCTKEAALPPVEIPPLRHAQSVIGIFENLHWHRYDTRYIERFLADCSAVAQAFPTVTFLVKPHHAGRWLTSRYHGPVPTHPNVVIADPGDPVWEGYTASQLMSVLDAVITTPSTVALDAARAGRPVALVGYGLDLGLYAPLPVIEDVKQWAEFVRQTTQPETRTFLQLRAKEFVDRSVCPGNAAVRLCDAIVNDCPRVKTGDYEESGLPEALRAG